MKFVISLILLSTQISASPIDLSHEAQWDRVQYLKQIFTETYKIPEGLIGMRVVQNCESVESQGKINLCIKKNGDLITVSVDQRFIRESLKIFQAPKQEQK